jgi:hypothetical protein
MARSVQAALGGPARFDAARQYVMDKFSWDHTLKMLDESLQLGKSVS